MQVSAEIRWFWAAACPDEIAAWFRSAAPQPGGGKPREDEYLHESGQTELGLKRRGGKRGVEAKGLVSVLPEPSDAVPFIGPIEIWCKWRSAALTLRHSSTIRTRKVRWLRKFDTSGSEPHEIQLDENEDPKDGRPLPGFGCNVELTQVDLDPGRIWWTLGFEAFGDLYSVEQSLRSTLVVAASRLPPSLGSGELLSYPAWLSKHVSQNDSAEFV